MVVKIIVGSSSSDISDMPKDLALEILEKALAFNEALDKGQEMVEERKRLAREEERRKKDEDKRKRQQEDDEDEDEEEDEEEVLDEDEES